MPEDAEPAINPIVAYTRGIGYSPFTAAATGGAGLLATMGGVAKQRASAASELLRMIPATGPGITDKEAKKLFDGLDMKAVMDRASKSDDPIKALKALQNDTRLVTHGGTDHEVGSIVRKALREIGRGKNNEFLRDAGVVLPQGANVGLLSKLRHGAQVVDRKMLAPLLGHGMAGKSKRLLGAGALATLPAIITALATGTNDQ